MYKSSTTFTLGEGGADHRAGSALSALVHLVMVNSWLMQNPDLYEEIGRAPGMRSRVKIRSMRARWLAGIHLIGPLA